MAPLTTSSVMVSLSLWVLWNCRPALYSWGLRGDKRPFNSERREVTEREALGEGYQSDIHHTNLSLGTGPAKEGPWRWSWAYMCESAYACACVFGVGVTLHAWNGGCRGRDETRRWGGTGLLRCPGWHGAEWRGVDQRGWEAVNLGCGGRLLSSMSHIYLCIFWDFYFYLSIFSPLWLHSGSHCTSTTTNLPSYFTRM